MTRILVTGSSGRIGRAAVAGLTAAGFDVAGLDRTPSPGIPEAQMTVGSIASRDTVEEAMAGADAVIHLAAVPDDPKHPDGRIIYDPMHFPTQLIPNNILGAYHVLDVARAMRVPRVILASTGQVIDGHLEAERIPVTPVMEVQPLYLYACTKVLLEQLGKVYSQHHGLTVLAVRLGWCPRDLDQVRQIAGDQMSQDVFVSPGDVGRFFAAACRSESMPPFGTLFCTSRHTHRLTYDLSEAKRWLGWEPQDQWPTGAEEFAT
jgi:nucleoside-diphosphate-sugar epimerase